MNWRWGMVKRDSLKTKPSPEVFPFEKRPLPVPEVTLFLLNFSTLGFFTISPPSL